MLEQSRRDLPVLLLHNVDPEWDPEENQEAAEDVAELGDAMKDLGHSVELLPVEDRHLAGRLEGFDPRAHVVFNWCEELPGVPHSEPEVATVLERLGFVFTGAPSSVLSLSQDKPLVKRILDRRRIPTPPWAVFGNGDNGGRGWDVFPAIVKAAHEHCSIGISRDSVVTSPAELEARVDFIRREHGQPALVEEFIDGREFHISAWGNGRVTTLPAAEMDYVGLTDIRDRLFTYEAKYEPGSHLYETIELRVPAILDPEERAELERVVLKTYRATGCRDYGRIDVRLRGGTFYVLDVNPNPDINPLTSLSYAAEAAGFTYGELGSRIVNLAAARHPVFREAAGPAA